MASTVMNIGAINIGASEEYLASKERLAQCGTLGRKDAAALAEDVLQLLESKGWIKGQMQSNDGFCLVGAWYYLKRHNNGGILLGTERWHNMQVAYNMAMHMALETVGYPMTCDMTFNDCLATDFSDIRGLLKNVHDILAEGGEHEQA